MNEPVSSASDRLGSILVGNFSEGKNCGIAFVDHFPKSLFPISERPLIEQRTARLKGKVWSSYVAINLDPADVREFSDRKGRPPCQTICGRLPIVLDNYKD